MNTISRRTLVLNIALVVLLVVSTACKHSTSSKSLGTLDANSSGIDGSVPAGAHRIYTLRGIQGEYEYTLRATTTNTNLEFVIYSSEAEYENKGAPVTTDYADYTQVKVESYPTTTFYEAHFKAAAGTSGDYIVVLSANSDVQNTDHFFYDLRLMSPDVDQPLSAPSTTSTIGAGALHIYNGGKLPSLISGNSYSISFQSQPTTTIYCPQVFIFKNSRLLLNGLVHSLVTDSTGSFAIFDFSSSGTGTQRSGYVDPFTSNVPITSMTFSSGTVTSPFIMIKGTANTNLNYYLTIQ